MRRTTNWQKKKNHHWELETDNNLCSFRFLSDENSDFFFLAIERKRKKEKEFSFLIDYDSNNLRTHFEQFDNQTSKFDKLRCQLKT